jgi:mRNA interferase MazF
MRKSRPVVIVSDDYIGRLRLRIVVPLTEWDERFLAYPWMPRIDPDDNNGLAKSSAADAFQVRSISLTRFRQRTGLLHSSIVDGIADAIALCVGYRSD